MVGKQGLTVKLKRKDCKTLLFLVHETAFRHVPYRFVRKTLKFLELKLLLVNC